MALDTEDGVEDVTGQLHRQFILQVILTLEDLGEFMMHFE